MNFIDLVNHMKDNNDENLKGLAAGKTFKELDLPEARKRLDEGDRVYSHLNGKMKLIDNHFAFSERFHIVCRAGKVKGVV